MPRARRRLDPDPLDDRVRTKPEPGIERLLAPDALASRDQPHLLAPARRHPHDRARRETIGPLEPRPNHDPVAICGIEAILEQAHADIHGQLHQVEITVAIDIQRDHCFTDVRIIEADLRAGVAEM